MPRGKVGGGTQDLEGRGCREGAGMRGRSRRKEFVLKVKLGSGGRLGVCDRKEQAVKAGTIMEVTQLQRRRAKAGQ